MYEAIAIPNAAPAAIAECKIELADILLFVGDVWEAKLLYAQVEKAYKHTCYYLLAEQNNLITGVLPLIHLHLPFVVNELIPPIPFPNSPHAFVEREMETICQKF